MLTGTIIFVHSNASLIERIEDVLCMAHPHIHVERTGQIREAVLMQMFVRADVIVLDVKLAGAAGEHYLRELKRDIVSPYIIACPEGSGDQAARQAKRMGVDSVSSIPVNPMQICQEIETQLRRRCSMNYGEGLLAEQVLQRVFMDYGIPCSLKGYRFLRAALGLMSGGSAETMSRLYDRIGEMFGCSGACVERSIRYVIDRCWSRSRFAHFPRPGNGEFIALLLEECRSGAHMLLDPKISVHTSDRRTFK